jgi:hypothetical protein
MKISQIESFGTKIVSSAEAVFYYGAPSKSTISAYLPEGVILIEVYEKELVISAQLSTGLVKRSFSSKVNLAGLISNSPGLKKIKLEALEDEVMISLVES